MVQRVSEFCTLLHRSDIYKLDESLYKMRACTVSGHGHNLAAVNSKMKGQVELFLYITPIFRHSKLIGQLSDIQFHDHMSLCSLVSPWKIMQLKSPAMNFTVRNLLLIPAPLWRCSAARPAGSTQRSLSSCARQTSLFLNHQKHLA